MFYICKFEDMFWISRDKRCDRLISVGRLNDYISTRTFRWALLWKIILLSEKMEWILTFWLGDFLIRILLWLLWLLWLLLWRKYGNKAFIYVIIVNSMLGTKIWIKGLYFRCLFIFITKIRLKSLNFRYNCKINI